MYKTRFLLQSPTQSPDGAGGYVQNWSDVCHLWGSTVSVRGQAGDLTGEKRQFQDVAISLVDSRGCGARVGWRLVADGEEFTITALSEPKGNEHIIRAKREATHEL